MTDPSAHLELWQAAVLGLVEGITEYLPVSSTGHLIITSSLMGLDEPAQKQAVDAFEIVIQGGAILAVVGLYRARVWQMVRGLAGRDAIGRRLAVNLLVAFIPAATLGALLAGAIKRHLFFPAPVMAALALGGIAMILISRWHRRYFHDGQATSSAESHRAIDIERLTWRQALVIGLLQCVAMWPGTSRSMMTIVAGMLVGLRPRQAAEFSFLLGLVTLSAACAKDALDNGAEMLRAFGAAPIIVGVLLATLSAAIAVKWLVSFLTRHGLAVFGWYRIVLSAALALMVWRGVVTIAPADVNDAAPPSAAKK